MNFTPQAIYPTGTGSKPFPIAVGDLNGDGKTDIVVANSGRNTSTILFNLGNGTFGNPVNYTVGPGLTWGIATSDLNSDGKVDIAYANSDADNVGVALNFGNRTFAPQVTYSTGFYSQPHSLVISDVNLDNHPDIIVANYR